jgi:hypothetical protein
MAAPARLVTGTASASAKMPWSCSPASALSFLLPVLAFRSLYTALTRPGRAQARSPAVASAVGRSAFARTVCAYHRKLSFGIRVRDG